MKKQITLMNQRLVIGIMTILTLFGSGKAFGQDVTLVANTSSGATGLYGLSTGVSAISGSGNSLVTISREATTINQKNQTPTSGCFGTSRVYLISSASGGQIRISLPNTGDYYLDKVEFLLSSNNTGATLSGVCGHYKWIQSDGTTYSTDNSLTNLTGYDQYTTICASPITATAVTGAKAMIFGRGNIGGTNVSGAEFRIWQIKVWIKQVISCTTPTPKTVSGTAAICSGSSTNVILTAAQNTVSYDLYKDGSKVASTSQTGNGTDNLTWSVNTAGTYTVKTNTTGGFCDAVLMNGSAVITMNTDASILGQPSGAVYTQGDTPDDLSITAAGTGISYLWYTCNSDGSNAATTGIATSTYTPSTVNSGTTYYKCIVTGTCNTVTSNVVSVVVNVGGSTPPTLTAASDANVDNAFDVTFSDDVTWRNNITGITIGGTSLTAGFATSAGKITFTPSASVPAGLLQSPATKAIVISATGYNNASVSQTIGVGAPNKLVVSTQPTAPASNGGVLVTQPIVAIQDQFGNATTSTATVSVSINGANTVNAGTTSQVAVSGTATFSAVKAGTSNDASVSATLTFSSDGLTSATSNSFTIPVFESLATDYYRTKSTGSWSDIAIWESSSDNTTNWKTATAYPTSTASGVSLLHDISYNGTPTTVGNTTVNSGVTLTNSTTAIAVAASKTLTIASGGYFDNQINNASITAGSGTIQVNGTFKVTAINSNSQIAFTNVTFTAGKTGGTLYIGGVNAPRLPTTNAGNVIWAASGSNSILNGTSTTTTIGGNFTVDNSLTIINHGSGNSGRTLTISGDLYVLNGQYNLVGSPGGTATQTSNVNGNVYLSGTGKLFAAQSGSSAGTGALNIKGNLSVQNPCTSVVLSNGVSSVGTVSFTGGSQQHTITIDPAVTVSQYIIGDFKLNDTNGLALASDLTITGNPTLTLGSLTTSSNNLTLKGAIYGAGTINTADGTLTFAGTTEQTLANSNVTSGTINNLVINAGAKLTSSGAISATNLTINSDVNGTGTLTGTLTSSNANVYQYLTYRTWYMASPVASATPSGMSVIKYFNEAVAGNIWPAATTMTAGKGYFVTPVDDEDHISNILFSGTLNTGNQDITLTRTVANTEKPGFNLIGNPYPSYLDWTAVCNYSTDGGITKPNQLIMPTTTMWYRTKASGTWDFVTINGDGVKSPLDATPTKYIPPMQAFWVRAKNTGVSTLKITDAMRAHAGTTENPSPNILKAPASKNSELTMLRLQVSNGSNTDEAVIYTSANAVNGLDTYDAPKMSNENVAIPEIYTTLGTEHIVINAMKTMPLDTPIGLGFVPGSATSFSIKANEISNLPADIKVILKDNVSLAETDLTDGLSSYTFSPETISGDRFSIIFRTSGSVTGLNNGSDNKLMVYWNNNNGITVRTNDDKLIGSNVTVYNALGQQLISKKLSSTSMNIDFNFVPDVYVVKVNNVTTKVIVK